MEDDIPIAPSLYSLSNKMDNSLLAVRDINHKYIVVESISKDAYQSAVADVKEECEKNEQLKELAKENAKNVIQGLISPILEQEEYQLEIRSEGDK